MPLPRWPGFLLVIALGCSSESAGVGESRADLMDPRTCEPCHTEHFREWSGSMHAYAAEDPVFLAMNERGQEETGGALGDFCVNCHAPLAVREGATQDGLNLQEVPEALQGVTCYFCHNIESVDGHANNPITLANDRRLTGSIPDPIGAGIHQVGYSPFTDSSAVASADACGACHDIVLPSPPAPAAIELERTFAEWKESVFGPEVQRLVLLTCADCHMTPIDRPAATVRGAPVRTTHAHDFPAIDTALTPFPELEAQRAGVDRLLDGTLRVDVCVQRFDAEFRARIHLDNVGAGHHFPSGASQDRRVWVELRAFEGEQEVYSSGVVDDLEPVVELDDPDLWLFRDRLLDEAGREVHMFWKAASVERNTLGAAFSAGSGRRLYPASGARLPGRPDRVTLRVRVRAVGLDVLDDLVASGHLDPTIRNAMPTLDVIPDRTEGALVTFDWNDDSRADVRFDRFELSGLEPNEPPFECVGTPTVE